MTDTPQEAADSMVPAADDHERQSVIVAAAPLPGAAAVGDVSQPPRAEPPTASKAQPGITGASSCSSRSAAGGTASSGLMIDGFLVPPHVLQALQVCLHADGMLHAVHACRSTPGPCQLHALHMCVRMHGLDASLSANTPGLLSSFIASRQ